MTSEKPTTVTRRELHALVWKEPRSKIANAWGISDVAIGKLCVRESIPAPPPGYWAKFAAGGKVSVTPLPIRLPGQREVIELRALNDYQRWNSPVDLEEDIQPTAYGETEEQVVQAAMDRLGPLRMKRDLNDAHAGLQRVLLSEANRLEKSRENGGSYYKPHFEAARHQRQLRILNSLAFGLTPLRGRCEVSENTTWIPGVGHTPHLTASVFIGQAYVPLRFAEPENPKGSKELPRAPTTTMRVGSEGTGEEFADLSEAKLEKQLQAIVRAILTYAERCMRETDKAFYQRRMEQKHSYLAKIEDQKRQAEEVRLAAIAARNEAIRNEIADAAHRLRTAQDIRTLVETMAKHPDSMGPNRDEYLAWSQIALAQAEALDPLLQPFGKSFNAWRSEAGN